MATKAKKRSTVLRKKMASKPKKKVMASKSNKKGMKKTAVKRKSKKVLPVRKGYHNVTAYLIVRQAAKAIEFYKKVFGAKEVKRMEHNGGKIAHAELQMGDSKIMLCDEYPEMDARSPEAFGGSPIGIHLYIKDVDNVVKRAVAAGAKLKRPVENMFYGDRSGALEDPFGHQWYVATHIEDVTPAQIKKRAAEFGKSC